MRHILLLIGLFLGLVSPAAAQQPDFWTHDGDRLRFEGTGISLPRNTDTVRFQETGEFSRKGEGLDASVQYKSPDRKLWATAYIYLPGVAHAGLAALATAEGMKAHSGTGVTVHPSRLVSAAGTEGVAIRTDFDNYRGAHRSSAAFIKADRWLIKLRVTGPQDRAAEVDRTMTALLQGLAFDGEIKPAPAAVIETTPCPAGPSPDALPVADSEPDIMKNGMTFAATDPAGQQPKGEQEDSGDIHLSRFGTGWCRGAVDTGQAQVTFLRATGTAGGGNPGAETALVVLYSDAGGMLEVAKRREEQDYVLLNHGIAHTEVLGTLDRIPSEAQIVRYLSGGKDDVLRTRASIRLERNGDMKVLLALPDKAVPTT